MNPWKLAVFIAIFVLSITAFRPMDPIVASAQSLPDESVESTLESESSTTEPAPTQTQFPESFAPVPSDPLPSTAAAEETAAADPHADGLFPPEDASESPLSPTSPPAATFMDSPDDAAEGPREITPLTVAQASALPAGGDPVAVRGIVVFAGGSQIVLQDDTGGMRICFNQIVPLNPGDVATITGIPSGSFSGEQWETEGTAALPEVASTLAQAPENLRVALRRVTLGDGVLIQDGFSMPYLTSVPVSAPEGTPANIWGVVINQQFYADTIQVLADSDVDSVGSALPNVYFGLLHGHTQVSDGMGSVSEAFSYAAQVDGLDFYAITDHSSSFDNAASGSIVANGSDLSLNWAEGKAAAAAVTDDTFVGLFGYEMTWPTDLALGHINTFCTPGWEAVTQEPFPTLEEYYTDLALVPQSVSQFNHPSKSTYGDFESFSHYLPSYDRVIHLLEVGWDGGISGEDAYIRALDQGWHLAPSASQDNHTADWGSADSLRTGVLAEKLTEESLFDAIRQHRVYATEDLDLSVGYWVNGNLMGSILPQSDALTAQIVLDDPTDSGPAKIEIVTDGGAVAAQAVFTGDTLTLPLPAGYTYYYLRITQEDGDKALTAPVWVEDYGDVGISDFRAEAQEVPCGEPVELSVTLTNQEWMPFMVQTVEISAGDNLLYHSDSQETVTDTATFQAQVTLDEPGLSEIQAEISGTIAGQSRQYRETLSLYCQPRQQTLSQISIAEARQAVAGTPLRIRGYVTAGTSNPHTTFPGTLYLQDATGGISVTGVTQSGIQIGCPVELTGILRRESGVPTLELTDCDFLQEEFYRYVPKTLSIETAMNYLVHGDELMQLEGTVVSVEHTSDGRGIRRFVLQDIRGDQAAVEIPAFILSGAYGVNQLSGQVQPGNTIRVIGFCSLNAAGDTVLLVRNCDEVVQIPPEPDSSNPKTADFLLEAFLS